MAQNNRGGGSNGRGGGSNDSARNFEDMSNADLIAFIGGDVDPNTNRSDLIVMAIEADEDGGGRS